MRYTELKSRQQDELNSFPMAFAFSKVQLDEGLAKLGVTVDEVISIGGGGFMRQTDAQEFSALLGRLDVEMEEALRDDDFMIEAILYELGNHEYCITENPHEALNVLGLDLTDERTRKCFEKARDLYWQSRND